MSAHGANGNGNGDHPTPTMGLSPGFEMIREQVESLGKAVGSVEETVRSLALGYATRSEHIDVTHQLVMENATVIAFLRNRVESLSAQVTNVQAKLNDVASDMTIGFGMLRTYIEQRRGLHEKLIERLEALEAKEAA